MPDNNAIFVPLAVSRLLDHKLDSSAKLLHSVWEAIHFHPIQSARILFPSRDSGYVSTCKLVGRYCINRYMALTTGAKEAGAIDNYGEIAERLYNQLPEYAQVIIR